MAVLDIFWRDGDGGLLASPPSGDAVSDTPVVVAIRPQRRDGPAPGVGDRVLAKIFRNEDDPAPPTPAAS